MAPHILIVDPDASAARITRAGVERVVPDATVTVEPNPDRGWHSVQRRCPDVLIIDPPQHIVTTVRLIQDLKQLAPQAQVIVLTSAPTPTLRRTLQRLGADAYLAKPAPLPVLMEVLQHAVLQVEQRCPTIARPHAPTT